MARILITGSTDGLGRATAAALLDDGHEVILHARNPHRAAAITVLSSRGADLVIADQADRQAVLDAADELNAGPPIDAVIHNAGVISGASVLPVNVVAPYLFTALLRTPTRHVYLSSGMHRGGSTNLRGLDWEGGRATAGYSDSKLFVTALSAAIAHRWAPSILANAVDPGWVPTKMGGAGAPDDFDLGHQTQERLATDTRLEISGGYWHHGVRQQPSRSVDDPDFQERLLSALADATGVALPSR
ncbi:SDR family NAD(P)-dependent oxidoreductase [Cryobacterium arcticum]|uniref:Short-chain dehydrogenase n=1 Tax=Cryobacterium arcticum TaxID=670052 RepID=A0A317ZKT8_9MICO|nr:SDR family NAD(P)-dependent oxidoreductase [Cryobacterium arcticum]PXA67131.1 short-chain dehydrogenase [Cryobacterium arcticum]